VRALLFVKFRENKLTTIVGIEMGRKEAINCIIYLASKERLYDGSS
jgi:hypothetical protein